MMVWPIVGCLSIAWTVVVRISGVITLVWVPVPPCPPAPPPAIELQRGVRVVGGRQATGTGPGDSGAALAAPNLGTLDTPRGPCFSPGPSFEEPP